MTCFDQTITIYNKRYDPETKKTLWPKTVVNGVSWSGCQRITTGQGLTSNDGYSVRIPKKSLSEGFLLKDEYVLLENPKGYWTAQDGDIVVRGEGVDCENGITDITKRYTDCFTITAVHSDNLNRHLPHLRVEGR